MINAIIFDFAGVIANEGYWAWLKRTVPNITERKDFFMSLANKADKGEFSQEDYAHILAKETGRPAEKLPQEILAGYVINPQMLSLLEKLKRQISLGLLSNFPSGWIRPLLKKYNIEQYFAHIVISSEVHMIKPHKDIFLYVTSLFNIEPKDALFIDDREVNVIGAEDAGLQGIVFTSLETLKKDLENIGLIKD